MDEPSAKRGELVYDVGLHLGEGTAFCVSSKGFSNVICEALARRRRAWQ
jgi:hypothetical protein